MKMEMGMKMTMEMKIKMEMPEKPGTKGGGG